MPHWSTRCSSGRIATAALARLIERSRRDRASARRRRQDRRGSRGPRGRRRRSPRSPRPRRSAAAVQSPRRHTGLDDAGTGLLDRDLPQGRAEEIQLVIETSIEVIAVASSAGGATTLVASRRPPSPTSSTAISAPARRNSSKATAVVTSKKVGWTSSPPSARRPSIAARTSATAAGQRRGGHGKAVDHEALGKVDEMRGRVARRSVACGAERRVDHRGDRAFAVGAGDVHGAERALGMVESGDDGGDVVEAELDPELFEREQPGQRIVHTCGAGSVTGPGASTADCSVRVDDRGLTPEG